MADLPGLEKFWKDFSDLDCEVGYFVTARLLDGVPSVWPREVDYTRWRHKVATQLAVDPMSVQLVGSARLGYSLNPRKNFKIFDSQSDLDIAIVSPEVFEKAWLELRQIIDRQALNGNRRYLHKLVFQECIALDIVLPHLSFGESWSRCRDFLVGDLGDPFQGSSLNYRIYRNHQALRSYQLKSVSIARDRAIMEGIGSGCTDS